MGLRERNKSLAICATLEVSFLGLRSFARAYATRRIHVHVDHVCIKLRYIAEYGTVQRTRYGLDSQNPGFWIADRTAAFQNRLDLSCMKNFSSTRCFKCVSSSSLVNLLIASMASRGFNASWCCESVCWVLRRN